MRIYFRTAEEILEIETRTYWDYSKPLDIVVQVVQYWIRMAWSPIKAKGLNLVLLVFSLFVLAGAAYFMSRGLLVNYKSGASNTIQSATGKLVKKGSPDFSPCGSNVNFTYALIGGQVQGASIALSYPTTSPYPKPTAGTPGPVRTYYPTPVASRYPTPTPFSKTPLPTPISTPKTSACTPLIIQASLADPFVGKKVIVTGTLRNGIFYAVSIKDSKPTPTPTPYPRTPTPFPTPSPYVRVVSPNGSESYVLGQTATISWVSGGFSSLLLYVVNTQGVVSLINGVKSNINGGASTYSWVANPPNFSTNPTSDVNYYKIRLIDASGKYRDDSDNYFTIYRPTPSPYPHTPVPSRFY